VGGLPKTIEWREIYGDRSRHRISDMVSMISERFTKWRMP
jgi:hypothetical protein